MKIAEIIKTDLEDNSPDYAFDCPGCGMSHGIWTSKPNANGAIWTFNGDMEKPTISPSIFGYAENDGRIFWCCHSIIRDGKIQFISDSTHKLAGQTVDLPDL